MKQPLSYRGLSFELQSLVNEVGPNIFVLNTGNIFSGFEISADIDHENEAQQASQVRHVEGNADRPLPSLLCFNIKVYRVKQKKRR